MNAEFEKWWEADGRFMRAFRDKKALAEYTWQACLTNQLIKNVETTAKEMENNHG